ncbi:MAG: DEAD/DEAH box helicase [Betaproteobacteria bacterium]|nr:DEAD/DEAH box helicase [Betaproteobacteria bacterium]
MNTSFQSLGLSAELLRAVADQGYTEPTPIQSKCIPLVLEGRDVLAGAQTGTGKTAGFTLPLLQRLATRVNTSASPAHHPIRALILAPTRELAAQVEDSVRVYGRHQRIRTATVCGGVGMGNQVRALRQGVDVLVATPGRLLDHVQQRSVDLRRVEMLVLDEADRMLDMGFIHDIRRIVSLLPAKRQNLFFSATFSSEIRQLADSFLDDPVMVAAEKQNTAAALVTQVMHPVDADRKRELLVHLIKAGDWQQILVFTRTKHGADRLAQQLSRGGLNADAIHGNRSQPQRNRALEEFKRGKIRVLVATDIAARGLDIQALPHVVNFDLPQVAEDYVHRVGRTGRAGSTGDAVSLVSSDEQGLLAAIERVLKQPVERRVVAGFEPTVWRQSAVRSAPRHAQSGNRNKQGETRGRGFGDRDASPRRGSGPRSGNPRAGNNAASRVAAGRSGGEPNGNIAAREERRSPRREPGRGERVPRVPALFTR